MAIAIQSDLQFDVSEGKNMIDFRDLKTRIREKRSWKVARRIALLMQKYKIFFFWTFTFYPGISNKEKNIYWNRFMSALRKHYYKPRFFKVIEPHKSGAWHFHVLFDTYLDWHTVQRLWRQCGAGKVVHVKELKSASGVAYYIAKYLSKSLSESEGLHCYSASPDFCIHSSDFIKWIWKLIRLKIWTEVKNIFATFDWKGYAKISGDKKKVRIRNLLLHYWSIVGV